MPRFISNSGSFQDLIVSGSRLYVASSSVFFNNLVTASVAITNVLMVSSSGQVFITASSAIGGGGGPVSTAGFITTGSIGTTQSITGSLVLSGSNITITGSLNAANITGSLLGTASYVSGSIFTSTNPALSASYALTASFALNGGGSTINNFYNTASFIATGSVTASVNVGTGNIFTVTSASANLMTISSSGATIISGSFTVVSGSTEFQVLGTGIKMGNTGSDAHTMTGSFGISGVGNTGSILTIIGSGSTNPIFTIQGSQGELFSVTDNLSGSLFSVNDILGLPILDVNSDKTIKIGNYLAPGLYTTARVTANTGTTLIYSIPTASYDSAYFDYNIRSGSVGRAGSIIAMWSGSSVNYSEVSASSFGTTTGFVFGVSISGSNMILSGSAPSNGWTVKTIIRSI
jgi:hypothetical protein